MADWRCVAKVCSIIHLVFTTSLAIVVLTFLCIVGTGEKIPGSGAFVAFFGFYLLILIGQIVVDVFLLLSTSPERIRNQRSRCYCRGLAFAIYTVIGVLTGIGLSFGANLNLGGVEFVRYGNPIVTLIIFGLVIPFVLELKKPVAVRPQQEGDQTASQQQQQRVENPPTHNQEKSFEDFMHNFINEDE